MPLGVVEPTLKYHPCVSGILTDLLIRKRDNVWRVV